MTVDIQASQHISGVGVLDVTVSDPAETVFAGFSLESPDVGAQLESFWIPLVGWVLPGSAGPAQIKVRHGTVGVLTFPANRPRPDIDRAFPGVPHAAACGFSAALNITRLPQEFELVVSGGIGDTDVELANIAARRRRFEPVNEVALSPLAITTLGRTGSTLVVTLLSQHPAIIACEPYKHDSRPLAYWLDMATALAEPSSYRRIVDSEPAESEWWLGRQQASVESLHQIEPWVREWLGTDSVEHLLHFAMSTSLNFSAQLAEQQGHRIGKYAAEKCWPNYLPRLLHELCTDTKEIVLVRDFRDMLASIIAFNKKRGYAAFGREAATTDRDFVFLLKRDLERLAEAWRARRAQSLLVRYEDILEDPVCVLEGVFSYIDIDFSRTQVLRIVDHAHRVLEQARVHHQTSETVAASVGRWRTDLEPDLKTLANEVFHDLLTEFGYE